MAPGERSSLKTAQRDDQVLLSREWRRLGHAATFVAVLTSPALFLILHNRDGSIRRIYQTTGVPESFVIDRDGVIVKKVIGAADWGAPVNENLIRRLLDAR